MSSIIPPRKNIALINPHQTIHKHPNEINEEDHQMFPFYFIIMIPNTIRMFTRAYTRNDYSLPILGLVVLLSLALYDCCLPMYLSIPKTEKSSRKLWLKLIMWCLYTGISFGFVYEFGEFFSFEITVGLYVVVFVCCVFVLCEFVIVDFVKDWKSGKSGGNGIGMVGYQRVDAGEVKDSDSVLEKV